MDAYSVFNYTFLFLAWFGGGIAYWFQCGYVGFLSIASFCISNIQILQIKKVLSSKPWRKIALIQQVVVFRSLSINVLQNLFCLLHMVFDFWTGNFLGFEFRKVANESIDCFLLLINSHFLLLCFTSLGIEKTKRSNKRTCLKSQLLARLRRYTPCLELIGYRSYEWWVYTLRSLIGRIVF